MAEAQAADFTCTNCGAQYKVVRIEDIQSATPGADDSELTCIGCGMRLQARDGDMALKYFLIED
jgi:hypothetical protein